MADQLPGNRFPLKDRGKPSGSVSFPWPSCGELSSQLFAILIPNQGAGILLSSV